MTFHRFSILILAWMCGLVHGSDTIELEAKIGAENVILKCPVIMRGNGLKVTWENQDGAFLSSGEQFRVDRVEASHQGIYVCRKRWFLKDRSVKTETARFRLTVVQPEPSPTDHGLQNPLDSTSSPMGSSDRFNQPSNEDSGTQTQTEKPETPELSSTEKPNVWDSNRIGSDIPETPELSNSGCYANQIACGVSRNTSKPPKTRCILRNWLCDGEDDCYNWWDEENCESSEKTMCYPQWYYCRKSDFRKIPMGYRCDGEVDCPNEEDEEGCTPPSVIPTTTAAHRMHMVNTSLSRSPIRLTCSAQGHPPPAITWRQNNRPVTAEHTIETSCLQSSQGDVIVLSTLTVYPKSLRDSGYYICEAVSGTGRSFSNDYIGLLRVI